MFRCTWKTNVHDVDLAVMKLMFDDLTRWWPRCWRSRGSGFPRFWVESGLEPPGAGSRSCCGSSSPAHCVLWDWTLLEAGTETQIHSNEAFPPTLAVRQEISFNHLFPFVSLLVFFSLVCCFQPAATQDVFVHLLCQIHNVLNGKQWVSCLLSICTGKVAEPVF